MKLFRTSRSMVSVRKRGKACSAALSTGALWVAGLLASCGATGISSSMNEADVVQVRHITLSSGQSLVLVNDGWLAAAGSKGETFEKRRAYYYSVTREKSDSTIKARENLHLLVELFETEYGFGKYAVASEATRSAGMTKAIEVSVNGNTRTIYRTRNPEGVPLSGEAEKRSQNFLWCEKVFIDLFNDTPQSQAVLSQEGDLMFDKPLTSDRR